MCGEYYAAPASGAGELSSASCSFRLFILRPHAPTPRERRLLKSPKSSAVDSGSADDARGLLEASGQAAGSLLAVFQSQTLRGRVHSSMQHIDPESSRVTVLAAPALRGGSSRLPSPAYVVKAPVATITPPPLNNTSEKG